MTQPRVASMELDHDGRRTPCQIQIARTPGIGSGYEMTARIHTCPTTRLDGQCPGCPCGWNGEHPADPAGREAWFTERSDMPDGGVVNG